MSLKQETLTTVGISSQRRQMRIMRILPRKTLKRNFNPSLSQMVHYKVKTKLPRNLPF